MQRAGLSSWRDSLQLKRLRRSVLDSTNEPRSRASYRKLPLPETSFPSTSSSPV